MRLSDNDKPDIRNRITEIRKMRLGDIAQGPDNWRTHPESQVAAFMGIVDEVGWFGVPLVYWSEKINGWAYLDGNMRGEELPDYEADVALTDFTDEDIALPLASYDPISAQAEADREKLGALLQNVKSGNVGVQALLAGLAEREGVFFGNGNEPPEDPGPQISRADELQEVWQVQSGDLWVIPSNTANGEHRVICGDCTDGEVVERVMGGAKAQAVVTDPPFGVRNDEWDKFDGDNGFISFTAEWLVKGKSCADVLISFMADRNVPQLREAAARIDLPYRRALIWRKPPGSQFAGASLDGFWFDFEIIQVFGQPDIKSSKDTRMAVLEHRTVTGQEHGCEKPIALLEDLIDGYSEEQRIILDMFNGTGVVIVACERLARLGRGVEIEPKYVAVCLERLSQMGLEPRRAN